MGWESNPGPNFYGATFKVEDDGRKVTAPYIIVNGVAKPIEKDYIRINGTDKQLSCYTYCTCDQVYTCDCDDEYDCGDNCSTYVCDNHGCLNYVCTGDTDVGPGGGDACDYDACGTHDCHSDTCSAETCVGKDGY